MRIHKGNKRLTNEEDEAHWNATPMAEDRKEVATAAATILADLHTSSLVSCINERLTAAACSSTYSKTNGFTIFRIPAHTRDANKDIYEPRIVSIGPYHHGQGRLRTMEDYKWQCLCRILSKLPCCRLEDFVLKLKELEPMARNCYAETVNLNSDDFTKMMLLDCCCIIQLLLSWHYKELDSFLRVSWVREFIRSDILLLENQIPFFILESVFRLVSDSKTPSLITLVLGFLSQSGRECMIAAFSHEISSLLHLYHTCFIESPNRCKNGPCSSSGLGFWLGSCQWSATQSSRPRMRTIPCTTKLRESGMAFRRKESSNFLDVTFRNGTIEIPPLSIDDSTCSLFVNLVAFEQCFARCKKSMTSYAVLMNCLVSTPNDIVLLGLMGIIENRLANKKEAVKFFTHLCDCAYLDYEDHCLMDLFQDIRYYYESRWPRWRARLVRDYFSNPWAIISFTAALILLGLTLLQTFFTVASYYHSA